MSLTVVFRETALRNLARIRRGDATAGTDVFARTRKAIASLAAQPRPAAAVPWGATGIYRLRADEIRVLYEIDEAAQAVYVINIGLLA